MRSPRNAFTIAACLCLAGCGSGAVELELITPAEMVDRPVARELAAAFESADGIRIALVPSPDGMSAADALESGYGDLAFLANIEPYRKDIAALLPIYSTVLHIIVREELAGGDYAEVFEDARIFAGAEGSASRQVVERFLAGVDVPAGSVHFVTDPRAEQPDIIVLYAPVQPEEAPELPGYTMISLGVPEDIGRGSLVDRAVLLNPGLRPFVIPMATYGELNPDPVVTVAVDELLVARTDLDDAVAYDLTREFFRLRPALARSP